MKKFIVIIVIFAMTYCAKAQDKRFTVFAFTDPNATVKDGFNMGLGIDYQMTILYFKAQVFVFPDLRGKKYIEVTGTPLGFNQHFGMDFWRTYQGMKLGLIYRDGPHPTIGAEAGIDYYFKGYNNGLFISVGGSYDYRGDGKEEEPDIKDYMRLSGNFRIGYSF